MPPIPESYTVKDARRVAQIHGCMGQWVIAVTRTITDPLRSRLGVRGGAMLLCTYLWTLLSIGAFLDATTSVAGAFHLYIPAAVRGGAWLVTAVLAGVLAWSERWSWVGLVGLSVMPALSMCSYGWSWVLYQWRGAGAPYGWYLASFYAGFIGLVVVTSFIPSPGERARSAIAIVKGQ